MKKRTFKWSLFPTIGFLLFGSLSVTACDSSSFKSAKVRLDKSEIQMAVGETEKLTASVSKGYDSELVWTSSNESVAYVDNGYVFGVGEGYAKIRAFYGGGYAACNVTVSASGEGPVDAPKINLNYTSQTVKVGNSFTLTVTSVNPADTTVEFRSGDTNLVTITPIDAKSVTVNGDAVGSTTVSVIGSNGITRICQVTVYDGEEPSEDYNTGDLGTLGYTGNLKIGSPKNQRTFMEGLLADFNRITGSSMTWTIMDFEEDNGTSGYQDASGMPAVFPYASDQTMTLSQFGALANVPNSDVEWIQNNMGVDVKKAASLKKVVGYPFAADNGLVMFYSKSTFAGHEDALETLPGLLNYASSLGPDYEVDYNLSSGFCIAPALMSYNNGEAMYVVEPDDQSYTATSTFNCENGIKAAKDLRNAITHKAIRNAASAPKLTDYVVATITDCSKVQNFEKALGADYAVAPLPYIDAEGTTRLGSFLGYKFYGINLQLGKDDQTKACKVARFLCSEYAQHKRFEQYKVRPTLLNSVMKEDFVSAVSKVQHIQALELQSANNGVIPMKAVSSSLWSEAMVAYTSLKAIPAGAEDSAYAAVLATMDSSLNKH